MTNQLFSGLPVPPALVYLLHQLKAHGIQYQLYGEVPNCDMVFVDIDRTVARGLDSSMMPKDWSMISPHFLSQRALEKGEDDPIVDADYVPEAIVIAYGGKEAEELEHFQALCEQVRFLRHQTPSRLIYHNSQPPEPMEIQELISMLKKNTTECGNDNE